MINTTKTDLDYKQTPNKKRFGNKYKSKETTYKNVKDKTIAQK